MLARTIWRTRFSFFIINIVFVGALLFIVQPILTEITRKLMCFHVFYYVSPGGNTSWLFTSWSNLTAAVCRGLYTVHSNWKMHRPGCALPCLLLCFGRPNSVNRKWLVDSKESLQICCHQMASFKAKMHQIRFRFRLGLRPRPHRGSLQRSPRTSTWI